MVFARNNARLYDTLIRAFISLSKELLKKSYAMSLGYAEKLSYRDDLGGQLGSKELFEAEDELNRKISQLVTMVGIILSMARQTLHRA